MLYGKKEKYVCTSESCRPSLSGGADTSKEQISGLSQGHGIYMSLLRSDLVVPLCVQPKHLPFAEGQAGVQGDNALCLWEGE